MGLPLNNMKPTIFVTLTTNVFSYSVADLFYQLREKYPENAKIVVHFWDIIHEHQSSQPVDEKKLLDKNEEFLNSVSKFLQSLGFEYLIIDYSDSRDRIFKSEKLTSQFYSILTQISLDKVNSTYQKYEYLSERPTDLGRIVHIVIAIITYAEFERLFPEFKTKITHYFTSKRLIPIYEAIKDTVFGKNSLQDIEIDYAKTRPIIEYRISSKQLKQDSTRKYIESQIRSELAFGMDPKKIADFLDILELGNNGKIIIDGEEIRGLSKDPDRIKDFSKEQLVELLTNNFDVYFLRIRSCIEKVNPNQISKTIYITNVHDLPGIIDFTNSIKYSVLKLCDGKNSAEDIARSLHLKKTTVQNYLSGLKSRNIVTKEKNPKRKVERVILQFD
jgi:hypothetical protein